MNKRMFMKSGRWMALWMMALVLMVMALPQSAQAAFRVHIPTVSTAHTNSFDGNVELAFSSAPSQPVSNGGIRPFTITAYEDWEVLINPGWQGGNVSCAVLGYAYGSNRVNYPWGGGAFPAGISVTTDGTRVSWTSTFPIGAVVVKGGPNHNIYEYAGGSQGDSGLASPVNSRNGRIYGLSNLTFCWNLPLQVSKTAETSYERTWNWTIKKTGDKTELAYDAESFAVNYGVTLTATSSVRNHAVNGVITIVNPNASVAASLTSVADVVSPAIAANVDCGGVTFPHNLAGGATLTCRYSGALPDGATRINTATVTTNGKVPGGSGTAEVNFARAVVTETDACVAVTDDQYGPLGNVCADAADKSFSYALTVSDSARSGQIACGEAESFTNTAAFTANSGATGSSSHTVRIKGKICPDPDPGVCKHETAWAANGNVPGEHRYQTPGNWATYVTYASGKTTTLFAGQTQVAGTVHFSAPDGNNEVTITITLNPGWQFDPAESENVKVQDYASAPSGNPAPGGFAHKGFGSTNSFSIQVPNNAFYGVHVDVEGPNCKTGTPGKERLEVTKTADTSYTLTHNWSITKTVKPTALRIISPTAPSASAQWSVGVAYDGASAGGHQVSGVITIKNVSDGALNATVNSVVDTMDLGGTIYNVTVVCNPALPYVLAFGETLSCTYTQAVDAAGAVAGVNRVKVTTAVGEYPAEAGVAWSANADSEANATVSIVDSNTVAPLGTVSAPNVAHYSYPQHFYYPDYANAGKCGDQSVTNIARVLGDNGQELDSATAIFRLTVMCP